MTSKPQPPLVTSRTDGKASISARDLCEQVARLFAGSGLPDAAAAQLAAALVDADLQGVPSHGVMQVEMYLQRLRKGSVSRETVAERVVDRGAMAVLDARHMFGHLAGDQAMALAIEKAKDFGIGIVVVRRGFHFGMAGRYALSAAREGCVGIAMCNTRPLMPAPGGAEPVTGNNPLAIALPTAGDPPLVLDMAMSEAAQAKIRMAAQAGAAIPGNWAIAADGTPTTDPRVALAGMLLPAAGAKGFGLALMIDLMCGLLADGGYGERVKPLYDDLSVANDCSFLFIAIDTGHFREPASFRDEASSAASRIRNSRRAHGNKKIFTPGERKWETGRTNAGMVSLSPAVLATLTRLQQE
jgi:LDH2 family malate/lactate/ureidoglycolate dehydrogenase